MRNSNSLIYVRKKYSARLLLGALRFSLTSECMEGGEYKHMLNLDFLRKRILSLEYRTGETEEGVNIGIGRFESGKTIMDSDPITHCEKEDIEKRDDLCWGYGNLMAEVKASSWESK